MPEKKKKLNKYFEKMLEAKSKEKQSFQIVDMDFFDDMFDGGDDMDADLDDDMDNDLDDDDLDDDHDDHG